MPGTLKTASSVGAQLNEALGNRTAKVGIIGLGYVGLPLVESTLAAGFPTMGFDVDQKKIDMLNAGQVYIDDVSEGWLPGALESEQFIPTSDLTRLAEADVLVICVPTPLTESRDPDLRYVEATARQIAASLRPGQLVILESTTYPGTTRDVVLPILRTATDVKETVDYFLGYSPERVDPGNKDFTTVQIPKVVSGLDATSLQLTQTFYSQITEQVVPVAQLEVAEACKILENTYRAVNIALVNELKMLFDRMGIDVWQVIEAAKTKPFGFQAFYPGPGLGGHCIPIDPFYLTWLARRFDSNSRFIELAGEINSHMPEYVVQRTSTFLNEHGKALNGSKVCLLGVAYKKDVNDSRESPALRLMQLLMDQKADVTYHDPHIPQLYKTRRYDFAHLSSVTLNEEFLAEQDCVIIVTDHSVIDLEMVVKHAPLVVDTRNATKDLNAALENVRKA